MNTLVRFSTLAALYASFTSAQTPGLDRPAYSAETILPEWARRAAPLAPGKLMSIYGEHLGPQSACAGSADAKQRETPNPGRPNQAESETEIFPNRLCDTEVRVGGIATGLLYVQARQINFKVPQQIGVAGKTDVQVFYKGQPGPAVTLDLGTIPSTASAQELEEKIWAALKRVQWGAPYRPSHPGIGTTCNAVPPHPNMRGGLFGYAYLCSQPVSNVVVESFYYPVDGNPPAVLLRRRTFI